MRGHKGKSAVIRGEDDLFALPGGSKASNLSPAIFDRMASPLPPTARVAAGYALTSIVTREDFDMIETLLRNSRERVRWVAVDAFEKVVAAEDLGKVRRMVRSRTAEVRVAGVRALAKVGQTEDLRVLESRFRDSDRHVRWEAVLAFGKLGTRRALSKLAHLVTHRSDEVGHAAGAALVEVVAHDDLSLIESMLKSKVPFVAGTAVDACSNAWPAMTTFRKSVLC